MAAYAALVSLLNNIDQIAKHPRLSTSLDKNQIQTLMDSAGSLLDFIEGYNHGGAMTKEVEYLERRIACAAHAAEDVIESHIIDRIQSVKSEPSFGYCIVDDDLRHILQEMDAIMEEAAELKEKEGAKQEQPSNSRTLIMETGESGMVGFEDELIQLMDELTNQRSGRSIISVVGMGGTGKTTLARNVYQNLLIKQHFDIRAWATISQQYNVVEILSQLLSGIGIFSSGDVDALAETMHKSLSGRRYLIILDDVWSVEAWDEVRHFFPDNGNRSRVVLTTRLSNVARDCLSNSCFTMKPLEDRESWKLLCKKAFEQENCPLPELEKVGKEISRLCRGLPLSTVVIGGLLFKSPKSVQFWESIARNIKSNPDSEEKQESFDILSLSYNHLPPYLKPYFLYMGVFKEDSEIRVSRITKLWIGEGFLRTDSTHNLEEAAEGCLKELIDRNLIVVSKRRKNGKVGACSIHDLLRDLCLKVGEQLGFFHVVEGEIRGSERRLICSDSTGLFQTGPSLARSIMAMSTPEQPVNYKLARVWDEGRFSSSTEIYRNVNLRYLSYQHRDRLHLVWELPTSLSLIWNLQTLIIQEPDSAPVVIVAPVEIWEMRQLRHVKCTKIYLPPPTTTSDGLFTMDNLQTLTTALNLRLSEELCKMIPNIKKLHIAYGRHWQGYDDSLIDCLRNLDRLHKLESLNLTVRGSKSLNKILTFPISLNKLILSECGLGWEDMSRIGSLPQLEVLELSLSSVTVGNQWSPVEEQFLRLKYLKVDCCPLHVWEAESFHFPVLEKLVLSRLWNLEEIPWGIGEIPTLEFIRVDSCSESAGISAVRIKEDQMENQGTDVLQVQVRLFNAQQKRFKERVEEEGMTIDGIQLL